MTWSEVTGYQCFTFLILANIGCGRASVTVTDKTPLGYKKGNTIFECGYNLQSAFVARFHNA